MSKNEDYLDQLLKQLVPGEEKDSLSFNQMSQEMDTLEDSEISTKKKTRKREKNSKADEDDFIRQFEEEMDSFHSDKLISEYELELDRELIEPEYQEEFFPKQGEEKAPKHDEIKPETEKNKPDTAENNRADDNESDEPLDSLFFQGLNEAMGKDDNRSQSNSGSISEIPIETRVEADIINEEDTDELDHPLIEKEEPEENKEPSSPLKEVSLDSDEDILDLLSGLSDQNEELSDIAQMLKADENHQRIEGEPEEEFNLEQELSGLSALENGEKDPSLETTPNSKKKKKEKKQKKSDSQESEDKPLSFFGKLAKLFFGEDEPEVQDGAGNELILTGNETPEELELLKSLSKNESAADLKKAEKKKAAQAKKEEKAKAAQEKKKANEAKKAEAKAKKEAMPPKEKPVDKSPKLPMIPVILIFVMAISTLVLVLISTNGSGYLLAKNHALDLYSQEKYLEAYSVIAGVELKENDFNTGEKIRIMSSLQETNQAFQVCAKHKDYEMGLDSLIRGIGRYRDRQKEIATLGITSEATKIYTQLKEGLSSTYKISEEQALKLYDTRKRNLYSVEVIKIVKALNLNSK